MTLVVIADDYGLSPAVGQGIRSLLDQRRLSGTSCMTVFPEWADQGALLRPYTDDDIGLHLTLTDHTPLGPMPGLAPQGTLPSFPALAQAAVLGRLDVDAITAELWRQVDAFVDVVGRPPSHLDGHHHVQQLPGVRQAVLRLRTTHPALTQAWVRTCVETPGVVLSRGVGVTRALGFALAGRPLQRALRSAGVRTNDGFTGVYGFQVDDRHDQRFARFLLGVRPGTVLFCHPGLVDDTLAQRDSLQAARQVELELLASDAVSDLLARHQLTLGRLGHTRT